MRFKAGGAPPITGPHPAVEGASAADQRALERRISELDEAIDEHLAKVRPSLRHEAERAAFGRIEPSLSRWRELRELVLAESQAAAATVGGLIKEIQAETTRAVDVVETGARATEDGVATVERVQESFTVIGDSIESVHGRVGEIAAAIARIAGFSQQMQADMTEVAAVAEQLVGRSRLTRG